MRDRLLVWLLAPIVERLFLTACGVAVVVLAVAVLWFAVGLGWLGVLLAVPIVLAFGAVAVDVVRFAWGGDL